MALKHKKRKCRPAVWNETILATRQEFFFTKVAPVQSITDIALLDFWLMLPYWTFISSYTTIYFFANLFFQMFIFRWIRYSNVFVCFFDWDREDQLSMYANGGGMSSSKMHTAAYRGIGCNTWCIHTNFCPISYFKASLLSCSILFHS